MFPKEMTFSVLGRCALLCVLALTFGLALPFASSALAWEEKEVEGTLHVMNPASPDGDVETITLQEQWRAGGEDDDIFFGLVLQVLGDEEGNTYLLDTQLSEVMVFDTGGEYVKSLSREGEGPGEVRNPIDMLFMPDQSLGLIQAFPGKIIKIDLEGNPAGDYSPHVGDATTGGFLTLVGAACCGDKVYMAGTYITQFEEGNGQNRNSYVAAFDADGTRGHLYNESLFQMNFDNLKIKEVDQYSPSFRRWLVLEDGRIVVVPHRNQYLLQFFNPDGSMERIVERDFESRPRNDYENKLIDAVADAQLRNVPIEVDFTKAELTEDIAGLSLDAAGNIWVQTSRSGTDQPEGVMLTFDVLDPQGHFIQQKAMVCDGDPDHDGLLLTGDRRAVLVRGFVDAAMSMQAGGALELEGEEEPAPMEVISYVW